MQRDISLEKDLLAAHSREQFPVKLYTMLELADVQGPGYSSAVTWLSHGRAFRILDEKEFMEVNVPMYFKQTKIRSFYRQLNLWGYKRVLSGTDVGAWYNDFFLRGHPEVMKKMRRIKIKGNSKLESTHCFQKDPDFHSMPPLPSVTSSATRRVMETCAGHRSVPLDLIPNGSSTEEFHPSGRIISPNPQKPIFPVPPLTFSRCVSSLSNCYSTPQPGWNEHVGSNHLSSVPSSTILMNHHRQSTWINDYSPPTATKSIFPCDNEVKCRLTSGLEPLPFKRRASSTTSPTDRVESRLAARFQPLPFKSEIPFDEFASYIGSAIQLL